MPFRKATHTVKHWAPLVKSWEYPQLEDLEPEFYNQLSAIHPFVISFKPTEYSRWVILTESPEAFCCSNRTRALLTEKTREKK